MSQIPPPPLEYATRFPGSNPRPTVVTVFAIIAIVFGILGILAVLCNLPQLLGVRIVANPMQDNMRKDPIVFGFLVGSTVVNLILAVMELAGGIGSLSLKPSGRAWLLQYAGVHIVTTLLTVALGLTFVQARNEAIIQKTMLRNPGMNTPQMQTIMHYSMMGGYCVAVVFLVWPILILYFMNRPHVKAAFGQGPGDVTPREPLA